MTTQNWIDLIVKLSIIGAALKTIYWLVEKWGVIQLQKSTDRVELAKANFLTVGQVTDFLLRIQEQEKKLDGLTESTTMDKKEVFAMLQENKSLLHELNENFTDFLKMTASNNLKTH